MARFGRPRCPRKVSEIPVVDYFKPRGIPLMDLETVQLKVEELESIRLVDLEGLNHEEAAKRMNISRKTLWRDLKSGRKRIAGALTEGKAIHIKGGNFVTTEKRMFICEDCNNEWEEPHGTGRPGKCPECADENIHRKKKVM